MANTGLGVAKTVEESRSSIKDVSTRCPHTEGPEPVGVVCSPAPCTDTSFWGGASWTQKEYQDKIGS